MPRLAISQIINIAASAPDKGKAAWVLQQNDSPVLRSLLRMAVDPNCVWLLPPGKVPYKKIETETQNPGMLYSQARTLYLFLHPLCGGKNPPISDRKREQKYMELLACLDVADAELLLAVKDRKLPPMVDIETIRLAFPGLI